VNTLLGNLGAVAHTMAPKSTFRVLHLAYQVFPDSSAAKGGSGDGDEASPRQLLMAKLLKGVHW